MSNCKSCRRGRGTVSIPYAYKGMNAYSQDDITANSNFYLTCHQTHAKMLDSSSSLVIISSKVKGLQTGPSVNLDTFVNDDNFLINQVSISQRILDSLAEYASINNEAGVSGNIKVDPSYTIDNKTYKTVIECGSNFTVNRTGVPVPITEDGDLTTLTNTISGLIGELLTSLTTMKYAYKKEDGTNATTSLNLSKTQRDKMFNFSNSNLSGTKIKAFIQSGLEKYGAETDVQFTGGYVGSAQCQSSRGINEDESVAIQLFCLDVYYNLLNTFYGGMDLPGLAADYKNQIANLDEGGGEGENEDSFWKSTWGIVTIIAIVLGILIILGIIFSAFRSRKED